MYTKKQQNNTLNLYYNLCCNTYFKEGVLMKKITNIRSSKICALCKYWYDPTNLYIKPVNTVAGFWEYESEAKCKCLKTNMQKLSWNSCSKYQPKF